MSTFRARGGWWVVGQLVLFSGIALAALTTDRSFGFDGTIATVQRVGGIATLAAGLLLGVAAFAAHGLRVSIFPAPPAAAELRTGGVLGMARHPIYGAIMLVFLGGMVQSDNLVAFLLALLLVPFLAAKAAREERHLVEAFPDYAGYRTRVRRRFIPYVW